MFENEWQVSVGPDRLVKDVLLFPEHFHLRKAFHLYLDQDFRKVLHNGNRFETRVFSQRCGVLWMVGWVGSVPNCWARGGGFETWIDSQPGCKKTARLQNARPTKYLTKQNCSRSPPSRPICKRHSYIDCGSAPVREYYSCIPCSISTLP